MGLGYCAAVTERVQLASGILNAFASSPFETAMTAMDLDRVSGGRLVLGLGTSIRAWSEGFYGMPGYGKPVAHIRETIEVIRLVIAMSHTGELDRYDGAYHRRDWSTLLGAFAPPVRERVPIWLAGNQRHLTRLAGELCEGSIDHPIHGTKWVLTRGRDALAAGLRAAGRDRKDIHWNAFLWVAVNPDRTEALDDARRPSRSTRVCGSTSRCSPRWGSEGGAGLLGGVGAQGHGRLDGRRQRRHGGDVRGPGRRQRLPPDKIMLYAGGIAETFYG